MQIRWKMQKNKFSDIGLASSKGLFFERPNYTLALNDDLGTRYLSLTGECGLRNEIFRYRMTHHCFKSIESMTEC